jgi:oxygen-independent coproporphyrinogen-3 oxidase
VGGGTPTILSASQLSRLLEEIGGCLDGGAEFTVEAGRADTLDEDALKVLKAGGVTRVSVNPQTIHDRTLSAIVRNLTHTDFIRSYEATLKTGFASVNCDLIFGLPGESEGEMLESLDAIMDLAPQNITVHTLAKKRTAMVDRDAVASNQLDVTALHDRARAILSGREYGPYYVYKQKEAVSGGENIGYTKPGGLCLYNIAMMGDRIGVLGVGANAASKLIDGDRKAASHYNTRDISLYKRAIEVRTAQKFAVLTDALNE